MNTDKRIAFLEEEIKSRKRALQSEHYNHYMNLMYNDPHEDNGEFKAWEYLTIKRLYLLIAAYLDLTQSSGLLEIFKSRFEGKIEDEKYMMRTESLPFDDYDVDPLAIIHEFEDFLMPFEAFSYSPNKNQKSELERLSSILGETHHVLEHNNIKPDKEAEVYREIKWLLQFVYPRVLDKSGARVLEKFKSYKPDILVPEVRASIEYKFIREDKKPAEYIDQLYIDAGVYHKDPEYDNFFAVMYFQKNKDYTKESIMQAWIEKQFPSNWMLILPGL